MVWMWQWSEMTVSNAIRIPSSVCIIAHKTTDDVFIGGAMRLSMRMFYMKLATSRNVLGTDKKTNQRQLETQINQREN